MTLQVWIINEMWLRWSHDRGNRRRFILHPSSFILISEELPAQAALVVDPTDRRAKDDPRQQQDDHEHQPARSRG